MAEELCKVLRPIEVATTFFSYEKNTYLSCVLPIVHGLVENLEKSSESDEEIPAIRDFKKKKPRKLGKDGNWILYIHVTSSVVLATAVDPRFKIYDSLMKKRFQV